MKISIGLATVFLLLSTVTSAQERLLNGGLGYPFSMTMEEAKTAGFRDASDDSQAMRLDKTPGMFDSHVLFFTAKTHTLWMIQGIKSYGPANAGDPQKCKADAELLNDGIAQKYPSLVRVMKVGASTPTMAYCESARSVTPSLTIGERRCIEVSCSAGGILAIDYLDKDLAPQMRTELEAWRKENAAAELKKRGLDSDAL